MILCGVDVETTGLDAEKDFVVELAYVLWDTDALRPIHAVSKLIYDEAMGEKPLSEEISEINGLTNRLLLEEGLSFDSVVNEEFLGDLHGYRPEYLVGHNGLEFDRAFLLAEFARGGHVDPFFQDYPWLDTKHDIEYPKRFRSHSLTHIAAELGFLNPFPHTALADVLTMFRILTSFPLADTIKRSQSPAVVIRALVDYENKDKAKARRYLWESCNGKVYPKAWVKKIKLCDLDQECLDAPFKVERLTE